MMVARDLQSLEPSPPIPLLLFRPAGRTNRAHEPVARNPDPVHAIRSFATHREAITEISRAVGVRGDPRTASRYPSVFPIAKRSQRSGQIPATNHSPALTL